MSTSLVFWLELFHGERLSAIVYLLMTCTEFANSSLNSMPQVRRTSKHIVFVRAIRFVGISAT
jgi:hypothetical protein